MKLQRNHGSRRGAFAPFAAVLSALLVGMVAFAVDIGWIVLARSQLQNAADAAALAGIDPLMDAFIQYQLAPTSEAKKAIRDAALDKARKLAKEYAADNAAGDAASLTLRDADIEFGFMNASGHYNANYGGFPNTIKVLVRRDQNANGALGLFFGPVLGQDSQSLEATASATMMAGYINNFSVNQPWNIAMLPLTYDVNHWNDFINTGQDPDGNALVDASGKPQLQVYPSITYVGNFGGLSLDDSHVGNNSMVDWIHYGMTRTNILALQDAGLIPLADHDATVWDWNGQNGFKSDMVSTVNEYAGKVFLLPLFKPVSTGTGTAMTALSAPGSATELAGRPKNSLDGIQLAGLQPDLANLLRSTAFRATTDNSKKKANGHIDHIPGPPPAPPPDTPIVETVQPYQPGMGRGEHYDYNIVQFVGVKIMPPPDANRQVILQPTAFLEPFGTFTQLQPAGTHSMMVTTFSTPKLTR